VNYSSFEISRRHKLIAFRERSIELYLTNKNKLSRN